MNLSFKDTKFIIKALNHLQSVYNKRLSDIEDREEYEDEASELENDILFLESLVTEIEKTLNNNQTKTTIPYKKQKTTYDDNLVNLVLQLPINERLLLVEAISESIRHDNSLKAS
jgi:hypothetical protein